MIANLNSQVIIKDGDGQITDAYFWNADNLPDSIPANSKFVLLKSFFDLPVMPTDAEIYRYYICQYATRSGGAYPPIPEKCPLWVR